MKGPRAATIQVSPAQQALLQRIQRQQTADQRRVRRASIMLALAANPCIEAVAHQLGLTRVTVRAWRDRWWEAPPPLQPAEQAPPPPQFRRLLEHLLDDAPRPGKPATFSPEQIVQIVAVACEPPEKSGRPIDHWTGRELADEVQKRRIVAAISPRSVGRFLTTASQAARNRRVSHVSSYSTWRTTGRLSPPTWRSTTCHITGPRTRISPSSSSTSSIGTASSAGARCTSAIIGIATSSPSTALSISSPSSITVPTRAVRGIPRPRAPRSNRPSPCPVGASPGTSFVGSGIGDFRVTHRSPRSVRICTTPLPSTSR